MDSSKKILIYSNAPFTKYRWGFYYSIVYITFISVNLVGFPLPSIVREYKESRVKRYRKKEYPEDQLIEKFDVDHMYEPNPEFNEKEIGETLSSLSFKDAIKGKYLLMNLKESPLLVAAGLGASILMPALFTMYLRRLVHTITLLPDKNIRFEFFSLLASGKPPSLELPPQNISCQSARDAEKNYTILKLKDRIAFHLVDKKGQFHRPDLFENYLGYERSWAVKK